MRSYSEPVSTTPDGKTRFERRKEATRGKIVHAANALFARDGYAETSMEDIAREADVAIRTIYLHFDSKAAILLAYFDEWLTDFVDNLIARPADEPVAESVANSLDQLRADGWGDSSFGDTPAPHPTIQFVSSGAPEIAGRVMHGWSKAQARLTRHYAESGVYEQGSFIPRARASAVFASWVATVLTFQDGFDGMPLDPSVTGHDIGKAITKAFSNGEV